MITKHEWMDLLNKLEIDTRQCEPTPISIAEIDQFEKKYSIKLPQSYREFCTVFGPGEFGEFFAIAVPGYTGSGSTFSLQKLQTLAHEHQEEDTYSPDPEQHKRGIFFCLDMIRAFHFFDPAEVTDVNGTEYAVYTVFRDYRTQRTADNFWLFVTECCFRR